MIDELWDKSLLFKHFSETHLIHLLLLNYYDNKFKGDFNEEDLFLSTTLEIIFKIKKTNINFSNERSASRPLSLCLDSHPFDSENVVCTFLDSINYFLVFGEKTFQALIKFFQISIHLSGTKIFEKIFMMLLQKYNNFNEMQKLQFFNALVPAYKKSELIIQKLLKLKSIMRDAYEFFQKEFDYSQIKENPSCNLDGIEVLIKEFLIVKIVKIENFEEGIIFFLTNFSDYFFCHKMRILVNVIENLTAKDLNEKSCFIKLNLIKFYDFLIKDFTKNQNILLTQYEKFIHLMDLFYKYFYENEILFSILVPSANFEKLKEIDVFKSSELKLIPKVEGIFFPFIHIISIVMKKLIIESNSENRDVNEMKMITILSFIKNLLNLLKKSENNEKNKKTNKSVFDEIVNIHSRNYAEILNDKGQRQSYGYQKKDEFNGIVDYIIYELLKNAILIGQKISSAFQEISFKKCKIISEFSSILVENTKNSEWINNFIYGRCKIDKSNSLNLLKKNSNKYKVGDKEYYFNEINKRIQKIIQTKNKENFEDNGEIFLKTQKIKEFFKNILDLSYGEQEYMTFLHEEMRFFEFFLLPSMKADRFSIIKQVI